MPLYEFRCNECGEVFEIILRFSENRTPVCPKCDSPRTQKKLSTVASFATSSSGNSGGSSSCGSRGGFS